MKSMFYMCIVNAVVVGLFGFAFRYHQLYAAADDVFILFSWQCLIRLFAYVLLIVGIRFIGAGNAAIFSMLEPVSGVAAGVIFLGETLPFMKTVSYAL